MNATNTAMDKTKAAAAAVPTLTNGDTLPGLLKKEDVRKRFEEVLGKKSAGFISSLMTLTTINTNFTDVNPKSILSAAMIAATLDLPINSNLGFAHIVPYSKVAQFQMGWKGFVQLAIRTGQYKTMNAVVVYEGELKSYNKFTGEAEFDPNGKNSDKVIGYYAFFRLTSGFEKPLYMTKEEVTAHAMKYSKSFGNTNGQWKLNFDSMALKTVVKLLLGKWGILSIDLQRAITLDQGVVKGLDNLDAVEYPDGKDEVENGKQEIPPARQVTALDVKIHQAKKELGEAGYYAILGRDFGVEHMTELKDLDKEVFLNKLNEAIKENKRTK